MAEEYGKDENGEKFCLFSCKCGRKVVKDLPIRSEAQQRMMINANANQVS